MLEEGATMATVYPHLIDPTVHPDYERRHTRVPTWETFQNQMQFITLRGFGIEDGKLVGWRETLDEYVDRFGLGRVLWLQFPTVFADNFWELVEEIKRRDLYLFDIWGHVPGSGGRETWGHVMPREGMVAELERILGDRFLGIDNGEQDGRYVGGYAQQQCPIPGDRYGHYLNFQRHFERMGNDLGNRLSTLVSLSFGHYQVKEGNHTLIGAETAQALPNSQIYYAFIRGAGKQYGIPWFGNVSVFNRWCFKEYASEGDTEGYQYGPELGTSLSLMKRLMYTHYQYNCVAAGFESGWIVGSGEDKQLSPIGQIQASAAQFVERHGNPGVMHTPVALMLDFFAGWTVPRHLYTESIFQVWGGLPYSTGDYLTHAVFSELYPGYEDASFFRDERGFLSPTPYGDIADCLLSDAPSWVLGQYGLVIIAGELSERTADSESRDKLERFVEEGGDLIITAANARVLWPQWNIGDAQRVEAGSVIVFADGTRIEEKHAFELCTSDLPEGAEVVAECAGIPTVVRIAFGEGYITLLLSPFALNSDPLVTGPIENAEEQALPCQFVILDHAVQVIDAELRKQQLFTVGEGLSFITCTKSDGEYTLGVQNNSLDEMPLAITATTGTVSNLSELATDHTIADAPGYRPTGFDNDLGATTADTIAGGDVRLFEVSVADSDICLLPEAVPPAPARNRALAVPGVTGVKEAILEWPTFSQHFDGVKVDWRYLNVRSLDQVSYEKGWIERQSLRRIVDFSSGLNFYPDLTLLGNLAPRYDESVNIIDSILDKMVLWGAHDAVMSLNREPEYPSDKAEIEDFFQSAVRDLCYRAESRDITLHLQHLPGESFYGVDTSSPDDPALNLLRHPVKWHGTASAMVRFVSQIDAPNLRYALNTGHATMYGQTLAEAMESIMESDAELGCILLNASLTDGIGQSYDAHNPVVDSGLDLSPLRPLANDGLMIFDAQYDGWDDIYRDVLAVETALGKE
jgi:hypothetical protein